MVELVAILIAVALLRVLAFALLCTRWSGSDVRRPTRSASRLAGALARLPALRALPRGAVLDDRAGIAQILVYAAVLAPRLAARHLHGAGLLGERVSSRPLPRPVERGFYRLVALEPSASRTGRATPRCSSSASSSLVAALRDPARCRATCRSTRTGFAGGAAGVASNTVVSFVTNTNWQYYGGETTLRYLSQMAGLAVQNFVSAAVGMAVLVAVIRGFVAPAVDELGNFWVDLTRPRSTSCCRSRSSLALILVSQGVSQTFGGHRDVTTLAGRHADDRASARSPRRSRSSSSAPTAAASTTPTRRCRSRTRPALTNFFELLVDPADPRGAVLTFGRWSAPAARAGRSSPR